MCVEVEFEGQVFDGAAALHNALPIGVVLDSDYDERALEGDGCLCAISIDATAALNGLKAVEVGAMYYDFTNDDEGSLA